MKYRLLAADMDGTVLNSRKEIPPETADAIHRALVRGDEVVFATGRAPGEMRQYAGGFPDMHYMLMHSGATVRDMWQGRTICSVTIPPETVETVEQLGRDCDCGIIYFVGDEVFVSRRFFEHLEDFNCTIFRPLYQNYATIEKVAGTAFRANPNAVAKINLYFPNTEDWVQAGDILRERGINFSIGLPNDYEISPLGVNKGSGLQMLCRALDVPIEETIAVGDQNNDVEMIRAAGLGVAMGNAVDELKAAADTVVADCDHGGIVEVIDRFLLGQEEL